MDPNIMGFLLDMPNKEIDQRRDGKKPSSYREAENFKADICASAARFVIDDRYLHREIGSAIVPPKPNGETE